MRFADARDSRKGGGWRIGIPDDLALDGLMAERVGALQANSRNREFRELEAGKYIDVWTLETGCVTKHATRCLVVGKSVSGCA